MKGGTFKGTAREIVEGLEREEARQIYCDTITFGEHFEGLLHLEGLPSASKIRDLHRRWFSEGVPLVIELSRSA